MRTTFVEFIPEGIEPGMMYVSKKYSTTSYICPCGCGSLVSIPFKPGPYQSQSFFWGYQENDTLVSLEPSVKMTSGCRAHYFIQQNKVNWCSDSGQ